MSGEVRKGFTFIRIFGVLEEFTGEDTYLSIGHFGGNMSGFVIRKLPGPVKCLIHLLVSAPRLLIALIVFANGLSWLFTAQSFEQLIMNSLALEFILSIDEMFFQHVVPPHYYEMVCNSMFEAGMAFKTTPRKIARRWLGLGMTMAIMIAFAVAYVQALQGILPGFEHDIGVHCSHDHETFSHFCNDTGRVCLPFHAFCAGEPDEPCFPYGGSTSRSSHTDLEPWLVRNKAVKARTVHHAHSVRHR